RHIQPSKGHYDQTSHHGPALHLRLLNQRSQDQCPGVKLPGHFFCEMKNDER
ncbi:MAG: hypothetical protein ACJAYC_001675, partial [Halieaceae bacterium]